MSVVDDIIGGAPGAPANPVTPDPEVTPPSGDVTPAADPAAGGEVTPPAGDPVLDAIKELREDMDSKINEVHEKITPPATPAVETPPEDPLKDFKPKNWGEVLDTAADIAQKRIEAEAAARQEEAQKELDTQKEIDKQIDERLDSLSTGGFIPPITNADDPNDAGRAARRELLGYAMTLGTMELETVAATLKEMHANGMRYDHSTRKIIAERPNPGKDAPVGGPNGGGAPTKPTYGQLRNHDMDTLIRIYGGN